MEFADVLNHVQGMYPGQLVLYAPDMAKILGKSEKAVAHLISRDKLPFKVQTVGGLRCVHVFQVAEFFFSSLQVADEVIASTATPAKPPQSVKSVKGGRTVKNAKLRSTAPKETTQPPYVPTKLGMGTTIMAMRHDAPKAMARFANSLRDPDEAGFMHEVLESLYYSEDFKTSSFVVTLKQFATLDSNLLAEQTQKYFETEDGACDFVADKLVALRDAHDERIVHLVLEKPPATLFHAISSNYQLVVTNNSIGLELNGL
jgi:hypothetical protein